MGIEKGISEGFFGHFGDGKKHAYPQKMWPRFEDYRMEGLVFGDWEEVKRIEHEDGLEVIIVRGFKDPR
jgi:hypothetical protein